MKFPTPNIPTVMTDRFKQTYLLSDIKYVFSTQRSDYTCMTEKIISAEKNKVFLYFKMPIIPGVKIISNKLLCHKCYTKTRYPKRNTFLSFSACKCKHILCRTVHNFKTCTYLERVIQVDETILDSFSEVTNIQNTEEGYNSFYGRIPIKLSSILIEGKQLALCDEKSIDISKEYTDCSILISKKKLKRYFWYSSTENKYLGVNELSDDYILNILFFIHRTTLMDESLYKLLYRPTRETTKELTSCLTDNLYRHWIIFCIAKKRGLVSYERWLEFAHRLKMKIPNMNKGDNNKPISMNTIKKYDRQEILFLLEYIKYWLITKMFGPTQEDCSEKFSETSIHNAIKMNLIIAKTQDPDFCEIPKTMLYLTAKGNKIVRQLPRTKRHKKYWELYKTLMNHIN